MMLANFMHRALKLKIVRRLCILYSGNFQTLKSRLAEYSYFLLLRLVYLGIYYKKQVGCPYQRLKHLTVTTVLSPTSVVTSLPSFRSQERKQNRPLVVGENILKCAVAEICNDDSIYQGFTQGICLLLIKNDLVQCYHLGNNSNFILQISFCFQLFPLLQCTAVVRNVSPQQQQTTKTITQFINYKPSFG